jgi:hypothetical protein
MDSPSATVQQAGCVRTVHTIASGEANGHLARAACRGEVERCRACRWVVAGQLRMALNGDGTYGDATRRHPDPHLHHASNKVSYLDIDRPA